MSAAYGSGLEDEIESCLRIGCLRMRLTVQHHVCRKDKVDYVDTHLATAPAHILVLIERGCAAQFVSKPR